VNDSLDGKAKQWYPNANLMLESAYKNGKYDGEWISYNERSFVISKAKFNNGNGIMESYDIRGNKVLESNFENNLKHGKEIVFDDKGKIIKVRYYDKNQLIKEEEIK
jgi:antitoxin component YwqK of YwqJK toxin-antitoxin module